jgi:hypothetical protein
MPRAGVSSSGSSRRGAGALRTLSEDRRITVFCSDGRLYQVGECARMKTSKHEAPCRPPPAVSDGPSLLFRVSFADYAWNATKLAGVTSVGVRGTDSVCVVGQRRANTHAPKVSPPGPAPAAEIGPSLVSSVWLISRLWCSSASLLLGQIAGHDQRFAPVPDHRPAGVARHGDRR